LNAPFFEVVVAPTSILRVVEGRRGGGVCFYLLLSSFLSSLFGTPSLPNGIIKIFLHTK
jgi:hypothetical protein